MVIIGFLIMAMLVLLALKLFVCFIGFITDGSEDLFKSLWDAIYNHFYGK